MPSILTNPSQPVVNLVSLATTVVGLVLTLNLINSTVAKALTGAAVVLIPPAYALGSAVAREIHDHNQLERRRLALLEGRGNVTG